MVEKIKKIAEVDEVDGTQKQWLLVSKKTNLYFRNLKKEIREKYGLSFAYDKIVSRMIKDFDKTKFMEELKKLE